MLFKHHMFVVSRALVRVPLLFALGDEALKNCRIGMNEIKSFQRIFTLGYHAGAVVN